MDEFSQRIANLSPTKRQLFEQLLKGKASPRPVQQPISQPALSPSSTGAKMGAAPTLDGEVTPGDGPMILDSSSSPMILDSSSSPTEIKVTQRHFYNAVNHQLDSTEFGKFSFFLNYGYAPDQNPQYARIELPDYYLNKNSVKLVLEVISDCVMTDRRVLDIGCGRGGTVYVINRFFEAKSITGMDLSSIAIAFCQKNHRYPGVSFLEGDAEKLPFRDGSFDIVTNIESSHTYPDTYSFYSEVFRVLTTGGYFLYTDVFPLQPMSNCVAFLKDLGFRVERDQDITANVLLSCDEIARTRVRAFDNHNDPQLMQNFLGAPGSQVYENMKKRRWTYWIFKLKKDRSIANN